MENAEQPNGPWDIAAVACFFGDCPLFARSKTSDVRAHRRVRRFESAVTPTALEAIPNPIRR